jgi:hypothetical protein
MLDATGMSGGDAAAERNPAAPNEPGVDEVRPVHDTWSRHGRSEDLEIFEEEFPVA